MIKYLLALAATAALLPGCGGSDDDAPAVAMACADLARQTLSGATIVSATAVPAGIYSPASGVTLADLPAFCRVVGNAKPTPDSDIGFEVWMPASTQWNKRYAQVGTLGYGGAYPYGPMATALKRGYAVASTDTGHTMTIPDLAGWAVGHPQKIIDYGYRAQKITTDQAKAIVRVHMAAAPSYAYFVGASNGGREALAAAQRYPDDFNGYLADGPALNWSRLSASWVNTVQAFAAPGAGVASSKLPALQAAALAACDAVDGVADGIVNDPRACSFNPDGLLCAGAESDTCLTAPQITAWKRVIDGPRSSSGARIFPGFEPFGVTQPDWAVYVTGPAVPGFLPVSAHALFGNAYFGDFVRDTGAPLGFDATSVNFDIELAAANARQLGSESLVAVVDAAGTGLSGVRSKGAKVLMSTGWEDPVVPPRAVIEYYESVVAGPTFNGDLAAAQNVLRLFMIPGGGHLSGGTGPSAIGSIFGQTGLAVDARHDLLAALEAWVERGEAPQSLVAASYSNNNPAAGVTRTRTLCPYPKLARWNGSGSTDFASNFSCVDGPRGAY